MKKKMQKKSGLSLAQVLQTDIFGLLWRCLKGVWASLSRLIKRSLNPSTGKRPSTDDICPRTSQHQRVALHVSPLVGVPKSHNVESLTVGNLFATVRWIVPTQASAPDTVDSVKDQISWD